MQQCKLPGSNLVWRSVALKSVTYQCEDLQNRPDIFDAFPFFFVSRVKPAEMEDTSAMLPVGLLRAEKLPHMRRVWIFGPDAIYTTAGRQITR